MESVLTVTNFDHNPPDAGFVYGESPAIAALNRMVAEIASTDIPILISGECGTGKEAYAKLIHRLSGAAGPQPRKIDCGSVDDGKVVAEFHDVFKNAGAAAAYGSVFLDGIDELDLTTQRVLLSLLSESEWKRNLSDNRLRLISSATRNLESDVEAGRFRRELYFRLNGACVRLPALRERKEDIASLTEYFLERHSRDLRRPAPKIDNSFLDSLREHCWRGNIRELENFARKIIAVGNPQTALLELRAARFQPSQAGAKPGASSLKIAAKAASRERERELILEALQRTKWNRKRAAEELQISYKSLLYKIKQIEAATMALGEDGSK